MSIQKETYQVICTTKNSYKFIGAEFSRQKDTTIHQQIISKGELEESIGATTFFYH